MIAYTPRDRGKILDQALLMMGRREISFSQSASELGVHPSTLRRWEEWSDSGDERVHRTSKDQGTHKRARTSKGDGTDKRYATGKGKGTDKQIELAAMAPGTSKGDGTDKRSDSRGKRVAVSA